MKRQCARLAVTRQLWMRVLLELFGDEIIECCSATSSNSVPQGGPRFSKFNFILQISCHKFHPSVVGFLLQTILSSVRHLLRISSCLLLCLEQSRIFCLCIVEAATGRVRSSPSVLSCWCGALPTTKLRSSVRLCSAICTSETAAQIAFSLLSIIYLTRLSRLPATPYAPLVAANSCLDPSSTDYSCEVDDDGLL